MALPKITHPVFKITIPSSKKTLSFRPYTVKEEKLLMLIKTSEDQSDVIDTLKQVITNCCVESIDVDKLAMFDVEYVFIKLRAKSVGEAIELNYTIGNQKTLFEVNLERVEVKIDPEHKRQFMLYGNIGVNMNYPNIKHMINIDSALNNDSVDDVLFNMFIDCIDNVFDDTTIYKEFTKEELTDFVLDLPRESIANIKTFFDTMPVLEHTVPIQMKDGTVETVTLRGLKDFFIF